MNGKTQTSSKPTKTARPDTHTLSDAPVLRESVTIARPVDEIFAFWRDFSNLPKFMKDLSQVKVASPTLSHWVVDLPRGPKVEWDAEIIHERTNEMISWRSVGDSQIKQAGSVWFREAPAGRGTIVSLSLSYEIPGGKLTEWATKLMGEDPKTLILVNLRRFKAFLETGEIPTVEGQPSGREEKKQTH